MHDEVIERIYTVLTKRASAGKNDPDMTFILEVMKDIPIHRAEEFYIHLVGNPEHFNASGFMSHFHIRKASTSFKQKLTEELWIKYNLNKKRDILIGKIRWINSKAPTRSAEAHDFCNKVFLEKITYIKNKERIKMFEEEELSIISSRGLWNFVNSERGDGIYDLKTEVELAYKTFITEKYFKDTSSKINKNVLRLMSK